MATETWYILEDGSNGDPREIAPDEKCVLKHKDGRAVAYAPHGPRSRNLDPEAERAKAAARKPKPAASQSAAEIRAKMAAASPPAAEAKDMKPADTKAGYSTRESKAG